jgi:hypothetical protein
MEYSTDTDINLSDSAQNFSLIIMVNHDLTFLILSALPVMEAKMIGSLTCQAISASPCHVLPILLVVASFSIYSLPPFCSTLVP